MLCLVSKFALPNQFTSSLNTIKLIIAPVQLIFLLTIGSFALGSDRQSGSAPDQKFKPFFEKAYLLYPDIPKGLLEAVAFTNTRISHLDASLEESCSGLPRPWGVMGLIEDGKGYFRNNLNLISALSGIPADQLKSSPEKNILGFARTFHLLSEKQNDRSVNFFIAPLIQLSELPGSGELQNDFALSSYLYSVLTFLNSAEQARKFNFTPHQLDLEKIFGTANLKILSAHHVRIERSVIIDASGNRYQSGNFKVLLPEINSPDYAPALWNPTTCNYSTGRSQPVSAVTIHTVQGSYAGCISWFKNCSASVSAHYVVRSSDGQITQMVLESNTAWHVGSQNAYTIGIEHEGFVNDPSWYTTAMYTSSAALCADIAASGYGIPPLRTAFQPWMATTNYNTSSIPGACTKIKGHQHYPGQTHTDPGPNWDWNYFYKLINPQPAATILIASSGTFYDSGGPSADYSNDERSVWTINPSGATSVSLTFGSFDLENTWDYLYVYDGADVWAPLIGYYTGNANPGTLVASTGTMTIEFRSDCLTSAAGWNASWTSNSTVITPVNLAINMLGCPSLGVTLGWQNSGSSWFVDVSDDQGFSYFWNKSVSNQTSVGCPGGFALNSNPNSFLAFQPATTYYWRIWDGSGHTYGPSFTTSVCTYMDTSCAGTFDDTGGPSGAYKGNEDYTNIIQPGNASSVTMTFTTFDLETNFDSLWIYDGLPNSTLIGVYTGTVSPGVVSSTGGVLSVRFKSDPFVNNAGWTASWNCTLTTGLAEMNSDMIPAYPNPATDAFYIDLPFQSGLFHLYNMVGEQLITKKLVHGQNKIELGAFAGGLYFYRIISPAGSDNTYKLILQK